jgi:hypothetical protein
LKGEGEGREREGSKAALFRLTTDHSLGGL